MFNGHLSHTFKLEDVLLLKSENLKINGEKLNTQALQSAAIDALCTREENWNEELVESSRAGRKPQFPKPINNLQDFAIQFLIDQDGNCGMTQPKFSRKSDNKKFKLGAIKSLSTPVIENEDGIQLIDLLVVEGEEKEAYLILQANDFLEELADALLDGVGGLEKIIPALKGKTKTRKNQVLCEILKRISVMRENGTLQFCNEKSLFYGMKFYEKDLKKKTIRSKTVNGFKQYDLFTEV